MQEDTSANSTIGTEEKVVSQLTDALDTQVTVSGGTGGLLPPPSSLPPQFSGGVSVSPIPTTGLSAPTVSFYVINKNHYFTCQNKFFVLFRSCFTNIKWSCKFTSFCLDRKSVIIHFFCLNHYFSVCSSGWRLE